MSIPALNFVTRDPLSDTSSGVEKIQRKSRNSDATVSVSKKVNLTLISLNLTSPNYDVKGKELDSVGNTSNVHNENEKHETELPIIIDLPCAEMVGSESGVKGKRRRTSNNKEMVNLGGDKKQRLNDSMVSMMKDAL
ncbi:uncharacterized protein LOC127253069 isoform X2 [Andrographis paniculata]|uniref:uncharacterized protein LOC127253069 isoform X2 n=1 Tax=Andrographis paniculata TaxID=175694 RepID=UPI0021E7BAD5|nr:uncharacterized protein LOC127253069 isoform X2 [Andrographis paniculata]